MKLTRRTIMGHMAINTGIALPCMLVVHEVARFILTQTNPFTVATLMIVIATASVAWVAALVCLNRLDQAQAVICLLTQPLVWLLALLAFTVDSQPLKFAIVCFAAFWVVTIIQTLQRECWITGLVVRLARA